jgi:hypothetical protein
MITIGKLVVNHASVAVHADGGIDGLTIDELIVTNTPVAISAEGTVRDIRLGRVVHHPIFEQKPGGHAPCRCGSGSKFESCCAL